MKTITIEEWYEQYDPPLDSDDTLIRLEFSDVDGNKDLMLSDRLWTEFDDNSIIAGWHFPNRLSYIMTNNPHKGANSVKVIPDDHDPLRR